MYNSISQGSDGYGQGAYGLGEGYNGTLGGDPSQGGISGSGPPSMQPGNGFATSGGGSMTPGEGIPGPRRMQPAGHPSSMGMGAGSIKPMLSQMLGLSPQQPRMHPGGGARQRQPITRLPIARGPRPIMRGGQQMNPGGGSGGISGNGPGMVGGRAPVTTPGRRMAPGPRQGGI